MISKTDVGMHTLNPRGKKISGNIFDFEQFCPVTKFDSVFKKFDTRIRPIELIFHAKQIDKKPERHGVFRVQVHLGMDYTLG